MELAADLVALLHASFIAFVVRGAVSHRGDQTPLLLFFSGVWIAAQQFWNIACPLTVIEANLRSSGGALLGDGFVAYYLNRAGLSFVAGYLARLNYVFAGFAVMRGWPGVLRIVRTRTKKGIA